MFPPYITLLWNDKQQYDFKTNEHEYTLRKTYENLTPDIICKAVLGLHGLRR